MACPTCDHTMARVNNGTNPRVFWCLRCGTLKSEGCVPECESPKLVEYAAALCDALEGGEMVRSDYERIVAAVRECLSCQP